MSFWIGKKRTSFASVPRWPRPRQRGVRRRFIRDEMTGLLAEDQPIPVHEPGVRECERCGFQKYIALSFDGAETVCTTCKAKG